MDFTALHQGVILAGSLLASVTFSIPPAAPQEEVALHDPGIISSYNLPSETSAPESIQNLNSLTTQVADKLEMVVKEVKAEEVATVEQPPVIYTVVEPTPKPSKKPEEKKEGDKSPEASQAPAEKKVEDKEKADDEKSESSPSPVASPAVAALSSSNGDILFQMTNDYRAKLGKPAFEKEERLCKIAESRAPQVKPELAAGTLHKGFKELNLPYWATENIAAYSTMQENFNFLSTDYIHRKAIESDAKYSCASCTGTSCSQIFSSFIPK